MGRIVIDEERCKACYLCIDVCPKKVIVISEHMNRSGYHPVAMKKDSNECIGCGMCALRCPDIAIKEVYK